jgi:NAD(P)-dependent dehydrogenase (short-subunit alcohol dehydrogenase family)
MTASNVAHNHRFGAYAASKAALNQMLRHMAAELKRKNAQTTILAMHPGDVLTYVPSLKDMPSDIIPATTPQTATPST